MRQRLVIAVLASAMVAGLAGCTPPSHAVSMPSTAPAFPKAPYSPPSDTTSPSGVKVGDKTAITAAGEVGCFPIEVPVDNGARPFATGSVTLDSSGTPASYKVAKGDVIDYIAARFGFFDPCPRGGVPFDYLDTINQVRRGTYEGAPESNFALFAGDVLNLSAYTINSVGDVNGKVLNGPLPRPAPAQR